MWRSAALEKLQAFPAYVSAHAGTAVAGFMQGAPGETNGAHAQVTRESPGGFTGCCCHRRVVEHRGDVWRAGGRLGLFTGTAQIAALVMNLAYTLSGSATVNPPMFAVEAAMLAVGAAVAYWAVDARCFTTGCLAIWCSAPAPRLTSPPAGIPSPRLIARVAALSSAVAAQEHRLRGGACLCPREA
jgi:hypothetical protein